MKKELIRDFYGKILGSIEEDNKGNKVAKDFYGKILGKYDKYTNLTKDFYGHILSKGDTLVGLIYGSIQKK